MSSHILMASVTGIALSTPAWAHDPAEAPIATCIEAILFDPAEAPIDREMKILWLENIEALLQENTAGGGDVVRSDLGGRATAPTGPTFAEHQPAPTNANLAAE
jgi:hypothetical protein